jgi:hypothetical protein
LKTSFGNLEIFEFFDAWKKGTMRRHTFDSRNSRSSIPFILLTMCESPLLILLFGAHLILGQSLQNCTAFSSNGLAAAQYQYYRFYDFRHMTASQATSTGTKGSQAKVVTDASWKDDWYIRDFPRKSPGGYVIPVNFVPDKVYISEYAVHPLKHR